MWCTVLGDRDTGMNRTKSLSSRNSQSSRGTGNTTCKLTSTVQWGECCAMCQHRAVGVGGAVSESAWGVREGTCREEI